MAAKIRIFSSMGLLVLTSLSAQAALLDIGVIGPKGEVSLYVLEGDLVARYKCLPNSVLGADVDAAKRMCQTLDGRLHLNVFRNAVPKVMNEGNPSRFYPLSVNDVLSYREFGADFKSIESMEAELKQINNFIAAYGEANADLVRRNILVEKLSRKEVHRSVIQKIESEVEKIIERLKQLRTLHTVKSDSEKQSFIYSVLKEFNMNGPHPCGLEGSILTRIHECASQRDAKSGDYTLVSRANSARSWLYRDESTGLLWASSYTFRNGRNYQKTVEVCSSLFQDELGFQDTRGEIPTEQEVMRVLKSSNAWDALRIDLIQFPTIWTSTDVRGAKRIASSIFTSSSTSFTEADPAFHLAQGVVLCVGR